MVAWGRDSNPPLIHPSPTFSDEETIPLKNPVSLCLRGLVLFSPTRHIGATMGRDGSIDSSNPTIRT